MTSSPFKARSTLIALAAAGAVLSIAPASQAQETPGQARARATTQSLNSGPAESSLNRQTRPGPVRSPTPAPRGARTLTDVLNQTADAEPRASAPLTSPTPPPARVSPPPSKPVVAPPPAPVVAAIPAGPPSAMAPLPIGYYVRGELNCNEVWQGEGNLAWLSLTAFTIDFGGCDPGEIAQVTDTTWHEDQRCQTELGGDGGVFSVDYEAASPTTLTTRSRLPADVAPKEDLWSLCDADEVPAEARFHPDDEGRPA